MHQSLAGAAPAYLADNCHLLSDAGRRPLRSHSTTSGSSSCHEHTTNLETGVSRQPVLDCGTIKVQSSQLHVKVTQIGVFYFFITFMWRMINRKMDSAFKMISK